MSNDTEATDPLRCPTCGEVGVKACVDEQGRQLDYDHDGRPAFFPVGFERIFPTKARP